MGKLNTIGSVLVVIAILLFANTTRTQDLDPSVRMKAEAVGGVELRETGYAHRYPIRIISGGFLLSGIACFTISSALGKLERKKRKE